MMDLVNKAKGNNKKGLMIKTWERCRSFGGGGGGSKNSNNNRNNNNNISGIRRALVKRSKSWPGLQYSEEDYNKGGGKKGRIAPEGCFSVYVGPQKQRFVIKTEYVNHPLFKVLLEEAESEYGYHTQGPLALPCHVDIFLKVLLEMDSDHDHDHDIIQKGCSTFTRSASSAYRLL